MKANLLQVPPGHIVIMPTFQCNVRCDHCQHHCSPFRKETMPIELFEDILQQVMRSHWSTLCISGGEPFLVPKYISMAARLCHRHQKSLVIQTNGFWGKDGKKNIELLKENLQNTQLGFSMDSAHLKHIPLESILQSIDAAYANGIEDVSVSVAYQKDIEFDAIQDVLKKRYGSITVVGWPIIPIGNAETLSDKLNHQHRFTYECLQRSCIAQLKFSPAIHPDGSLHACYKTIMTLEEKDPFILGNLKEKKLDDLLANVDNRLLLFTIAMGGGNFGDLLSDSPYSKVLEKQYLGVCHFCHHVLSNTKIRKYIETLLAYDGFEEKIQTGLQRAYTGFSSGKKESQTDNVIVVCNGKHCSRHYNNYVTIHYLMNKLVASGKMEKVSIEFTDCLHHCEEGPNLFIQKTKKMVSKVDKSKIDAIIDEI